jgi:hypothetical protein
VSGPTAQAREIPWALPLHSLGSLPAMRSISHSTHASLLSGVVLLALAAGCPADPADTAGTTDTSAATDTESATDAQDTVVTDAGGTSEPGGCEPADPLALVAIAVELGDFPVAGVSPDGYRFDAAPCTVTAVDLSVATRVRTELDCEAAAGTTHAVALEHRSAELGGPVWAAGDPLLLSVQLRVYSDLNDIPLWDVSLHSPAGEPRLLLMDTDQIDLGGSITAPLELSLDEDACPSENGTEDTRGRLSLTLDGVTTTVLDGHDGTLETPAGTWAVELPRAHVGDFGERSLYFDLLVMKVQ